MCLNNSGQGEVNLTEICAMLRICAMKISAENRNSSTEALKFALYLQHERK